MRRNPIAVTAVALALAWALSACARPATPVAPAAPPRAAAPAAPSAQAPSRTDTRTSLIGESIAVQDGDSFVLRTVDGRKLRIRIAGIDAPERGQPFADVSRRHLAQLLAGGQLRLQVSKTDVFGREVAQVSDAAGRDAGLAQLEAGLAWFFRRYASEQPPAQRRAYAQAEATARQARLGLWRDPKPLPPWDFRRGQRAPR